MIDRTRLREGLVLFRKDFLQDRVVQRQIRDRLAKTRYAGNRSAIAIPLHPLSMSFIRFA